MVKIRVTGETTFKWIDAKYDEPGFPAECSSQSTFYEDCFQGNGVKEDEYSVKLSATVQGEISFIDLH